jgi:outer membrane protein
MPVSSPSPSRSEWRVPSRTLLAAALLLAAGAAVPAAAQAVKIAVINTEQVLLESTTGKAALAELRQLREAKEAEGNALQKEVEDLRKRLTEGRLSLAEDKIAELEQQLEEKGIELRRFQDDASRELNKRRDEVLATIDRKVLPIINELGREQGYSLIFRKFESGLVFASEEVDITGEIIRRLDASAAAPAAAPGAGSQR